MSLPEDLVGKGPCHRAWRGETGAARSTAASRATLKGRQGQDSSTHTVCRWASGPHPVAGQGGLRSGWSEG